MKVMNSPNNKVARFFILCISLGLLIIYSRCEPDQKDKEILGVQSFLEKNDGSTWTVIEADMRVYARLNDDVEKEIELWISEMAFGQLMNRKECYYHLQEILYTKEVEVLEHSGSTLSFRYLDENYTFSKDGKSLKLEFESSDKIKKTIYFSKSDEKVDDLDICPEKTTQVAFDWPFLKGGDQ
ncbi:hypothetical protein LCM02_04735 [Lutimonas saemankumensis]|uniref:hypothetical protein n=1 Tax=Lutimonas saemankumensis TaxID=483016 RepID=UPI001CD5244E|nr:hypothetical protein [Lutimonas saemankumensis]MCA0931747.1 hypothetical protein [Lutimonas saemankumensis]